MKSAIHQGDLGELLARYQGKFAGRDQECAAFVQTVTTVGHTSRWQPGGRVVEQNFITPGTVIANFIFENGKGRYPNRNGWHVAIFLSLGNRDSKGNLSHIWVLDQWRGRTVARRSKKAFSTEDAKRMQIKPANNANDYYIVNVL